ncbi:MAG: hypothetical protein ACLSFT_01385 [Ruminococcus callidus]
MQLAQDFGGAVKWCGKRLESGLLSDAYGCHERSLISCQRRVQHLSWYGTLDKTCSMVIWDWSAVLGDLIDGGDTVESQSWEPAEGADFVAPIDDFFAARCRTSPAAAFARSQVESA